LTSSAKNTANCFIGDAILSRNFTEWFTQVNAMKNGRPLRNGYFPVWVRTWAALLIGEAIGWVLVDKHIISAWEKLCERNK
jgi:hypothetical protein